LRRNIGTPKQKRGRRKPKKKPSRDKVSGRKKKKESDDLGERRENRTAWGDCKGLP